MANGALVVHNDLGLGEVSEIMVKSGFFQDSRDAAKAAVKILAGQELGFGPIASMTGVNIIQGKVTLSANLIAAAIARHPHYKFRVVEHTNEKCSIDYYEDNEKTGSSSFTLEDARKAGLGGINWTKYPRNMLFARAISNGAKWYCTAIFGGPIYTPDELGAEVDGETGQMVSEAPQPEPVSEDTTPKEKPREPAKPDEIGLIRKMIEDNGLMGKMKDKLSGEFNLAGDKNNLKELVQNISPEMVESVKNCIRFYVEVKRAGKKLWNGTTPLEMLKEKFGLRLHTIEKWPEGLSEALAAGEDAYLDAPREPMKKAQEKPTDKAQAEADAKDEEFRQQLLDAKAQDGEEGEE